KFIKNKNFQKHFFYSINRLLFSDVTFELTNLLQMNLAEQAKNVQLVLTQCEFLHPSLFKPVKIPSGCGTDKISTSEKSDYINSEKKGVHSQEVDEQTNITTPTGTSPSSQNEVKYVLEQILENVVKLETNNQEYTSKNNIQEMRCLLEDILEKVIMSPREKRTEETICHKINENIFTTSENSLPIPLNSGENKRNFLSMDQYSLGAKVKTSSQKMDVKLTCNTITEEAHLQEVPNLKIMDEVPRKRTKDQTKFKFSKSQKNALKFPQTPLCYLEVCRKLDDDSKNTCKCMKCLPQQNRYYCSCFDLICKDLDEKTEIIQNEPVPLLQKLQDQNQLKPSKNKPKRKVLGDVCDICREKKCNCAFKSRPKIGRSPPT
ncbi:unnamed protein product, partial [Diabrotica balteata]